MCKIDDWLLDKQKVFLGYLAIRKHSKNTTVWAIGVCGGDGGEGGRNDQDYYIQQVGQLGKKKHSCYQDSQKCQVKCSKYNFKCRGELVRTKEKFPRAEREEKTTNNSQQVANYSCHRDVFQFQYKGSINLNLMAIKREIMYAVKTEN